MKRILTIAFVLSLFAGAPALFDVSAGAAKSVPAAMPQGAPLKTLQGTVKVDGDKVIFVADDDNKSWEVLNPDTLKAHAGHHVEVSAHIYADKNQMHVMSVKMVKKGEK
jgi:hypothetical protein